MTRQGPCWWSLWRQPSTRSGGEGLGLRRRQGPHQWGQLRWPLMRGGGEVLVRRSRWGRWPLAQGGWGAGHPGRGRSRTAPAQHQSEGRFLPCIITSNGLKGTACFSISKEMGKVYMFYGSREETTRRNSKQTALTEYQGLLMLLQVISPVMCHKTLPLLDPVYRSVAVRVCKTRLPGST